MAGLPPMTETESKLRNMGCTMDQRKRLMMASKFGLGPLGSMGLADPKGPRSRSPPPLASRALPPSGGSSSSTALAPGGHKAPAASAETVQRRQTEQAARAQAISRGGMAVKAMASAVVMQRDEEEDLDSFLAGGRKMAVQAQKVLEDRKRSREAFEDNLEDAKKAPAEDRMKEAERQARDKKKREEARRKREEEEKKQEERRRRREEEKRRKREEKARQKELEHSRDDEDVADDDDSEDGRKKEGSASGLFKAVMKGDDAKRMHWGESVKGRVSGDYKGLTDAELERRFSSMSSKSGEKLMTEQEVLAMLKKGKSKK